MSVTKTRARINKKITKHKLLICHLYSELNTLSPIYRLPPELLATIFIACASDYHNNTKDFRFTRTVPTWVDISYVCRYWRGIALDCAALWTYHFVVSSRWTEELLVRSKQALLKTSGNPKIENDERLDAVEKLMTQAERIQGLHLDLSENGIYQEKIIRLLSSRAPCLQTLELKLRAVHSSKRYPVPFRGDTPALRTLKLTDCPVPWYLLNLSGLTTLTLRRVPVCFQEKTKEFLDTLRQMQDLTHLELDDAVACADGFLHGPVFHTWQKINLPHLSHLLIVAPLSTVIALLSCVNIPLKTELRLACHSADGRAVSTSPRHDYTLLFSILAQRFGLSLEDGFSLTIRSLVIQFFDLSVKLTFCGSERYLGSRPIRSRYCPANWDCNIPLEIIIRCRTAPYDSCVAVGDILSSIPLTNVQSLYVVHPPLSQTFWSTTLGCLQALRHLKLSVGGMPDLASLLTLDARKSQGGHATRDLDTDCMLTPDLEELKLRRISFSGYGNVTSAITQDCLFDALSTRLNAPQSRLTMIGCTIRLFGQLDVVRSWDGVVISEYPSDSDDPDSDDSDSANSDSDSDSSDDD